MPSPIFDLHRILCAWLRRPDTPLYDRVAARVLATPPGAPRDPRALPAISFALDSGQGPEAPARLERIGVVFSAWASTPAAAYATAQELDLLVDDAEEVRVTVDDATYLIVSARRRGVMRQKRASAEGRLWCAWAPYEILVMTRPVTAFD
jgi:hypothetical protein